MSPPYLTDDDIMQVVGEEEDDEEDNDDEDAINELPTPTPTSGQVLQYLESISKILDNKPDAAEARGAVDTLRMYTMSRADALKSQSTLDTFFSK